MRSRRSTRVRRLGVWLAAPLLAHAASAGPTARVFALRAGERSAGGTAFFVRAAGASGAAAIGTAHGLPLETLAAAERVEFELGGAAPPAISRALLAVPGRSYAAAGGSFADDFHLYALEAAPAGAELLEFARTAPLAAGLAVEILGPPPANAASVPAQRLAGTLTAATPLRIEIQLHGASELEGWGGAPVLRAGSSEVIGILQAVRAQASGTTLVAAPLGRVREALLEPLRAGRGQPFAKFAVLLPMPIAEREVLGQEPEHSGLALTLEYPPDGSAVADSGCGVFVAGRAEPAALRRFDVIFALDVSSSTQEASGSDIDGDGVIGAPSAGPLAALSGSERADPGDSVAAAEIAAARALLARLDPRSARVGLVSFSGFDASGRLDSVWEGLRGSLGAARLHAETLAPLTRDYAAVERALDRLLERTPIGHTHIAAGLDQAIGELAGVRGARSQRDPASQKVVFLFTDGEPTLPYPGHPAANTRVVLEAAERARGAGVRVHTFAVGAQALARPIVTVELAARTGGVFTPVRQPGDLALAIGLAELPRLSDLELSSGAAGSEARIFRMTPDGLWAGFVPIEAAGLQELRIRAVAQDGSRVSRSVRVRRGPAAQAAEIPAALAARRNELLEECLLLVRADAQEAERLRAEQLRERLREEILREREQARARAAQQRRELELEVEMR